MYVPISHNVHSLDMVDVCNVEHQLPTSSEKQCLVSQVLDIIFLSIVSQTS